MRTRTRAALVTSVAIASWLVAAGSVPARAQRATLRPDLSGRWTLNQELSEDAQAKVERMRSSQGGAGRHGGLIGGLFGGGSTAQVEEAHDLLLNAPSSFTLTQDGDRIVRTDGDGRVRTLTANGRKETVNGRAVRTKWDDNRLVSEISLGRASVIETYERLTDAPQLIVTTRMDMGGRVVSVRRVYDAGSEQ
jgi:hypothetical protein